MKGLLLAVGFTVLYAVLVTLLFLAANVRNRVAVMTGAFLGTVPLFVVAYAGTPSDLGVLPLRLVEPRPVLELAWGLFVYTSLVLGGVLQAYNLAERGFSLRVLIDIEESPERALSHAEVLQGYSAGRGLGWMLDKRIEGLEELRLIVVDRGQCRVTARGAYAARPLSALRAFLRLELAR